MARSRTSKQILKRKFIGERQIDLRKALFTLNQRSTASLVLVGMSIHTKYQWNLE